MCVIVFISIRTQTFIGVINFLHLSLDCGMSVNGNIQLSLQVHQGSASDPVRSNLNGLGDTIVQFGDSSTTTAAFHFQISDGGHDILRDVCGHGLNTLK